MFEIKSSILFLHDNQVYPVLTGNPGQILVHAALAEYFQQPGKIIIKK